MTSSFLLLLVCAAIGIQAAVAFAIAVGRHARAHSIAVARTGAPAAAPSVLVPPAGPAAWTGWRSLRVAARAHADASASVLVLTLVAPDGAPLPRYAPGQYLRLRVHVADGAGIAQPLVRCYSLSDRWHADHYQVSVKRVVEARPGIVSAYLHDRIQVGDLIEACAPAGDFVLQGGTEPVVLIAGGIGLTPLLAMLETVLVEAPARRVWLFYGVRHGGEHAMRERLTDLAQAFPQLRLHVRYSRPRPQDLLGRDHHSVGHLDIGLLRQVLPLQTMQFYVCGPGPLLSSLVPALHEWGVAPDLIHHEAFGPSSLPVAARLPAAAAQASGPEAVPTQGATASAVRFARQGRSFDWDSAAGNLLAFAEAHGIALEFGCRAGACGACATRVLAGRTHYAQPPAVEVASDHCLPCLAQPIGALELDA